MIDHPLPLGFLGKIMRRFRYGMIRRKRDICEAMVTELLTDSRKVVDDWDRVRRKNPGRSNA